ncbi:ubiquitin-specific protease doa4, partial [Ascosphaera atra]
KRPQESPSVNVQKEDSDQAKPSGDTDILALRFAELRKSHSRPGRTSEYFERLATSSPTANNTPSAVSPAPSPHVSDLKIPRQRPMSTSEHSDASSANSPTLQQQQPPIRPMGPRSMHSSPAPGAAFPQIPPKLPIPPSSLPRSPPSAYSPVVSSVPTSAPRPPTALVDNPNRSYAYQSRSLWPGGTPDEMFISSGYQAYRPDGMSTPTQRPIRTPPQSSVPHMTVLKPPSLVKYMKEHTVLLIDVREREIFDEGHIFSNNVICIEPIELQSNTSADELEERLIYSPPVEADLFARRNQFDLVVYYDQKTADASFLVGSPADCSRPHLRALHDSLYVFSRDKPLKDGRPPALLAGGLDAWIDYMGPQALTLTKTAAASGKE